MKRVLLITVLTVFTVVLPALFSGMAVAAPMGTVLTYQGNLNQTGSGNIIGQPSSSGPVTAVCDFRFSLWDAITNGNLIAGPLTNSFVSVSNGLFTVGLDFGTNAFNGEGR